MKPRTFICEKCGKILCDNVPEDLKINGVVEIRCIECATEFTCGTGRVGLSFPGDKRESLRRRKRCFYNTNGFNIDNIDEEKCSKFGWWRYILSFQSKGS